MRGLILAGGTGSRLWPATLAVSKQLLPLHDRPMIYFPLSVLLLAGIRDILVISTPRDTPRFQHLLGGGEQWGVNLSYAVQPSPNGGAAAFLLGAEFIGSGPSALALGDNIFHGPGLVRSLEAAAAVKKGARVFARKTEHPRRYGVVVLDENGRAVDIEEKPDRPRSNYAVTGLYFYDAGVLERARALAPSVRGELEITDLNRGYLDDGALHVEVLDDDVAWWDAGDPDALLDAAHCIRAIEREQGVRPGCPEEICWRLGYIDDGQLADLAAGLGDTGHGRYLGQLLEGDRSAGAPDGKSPGLPV